MRTVTMRVPVAGIAPDRAFDLIRDFPRYPELTDAVEKVVVAEPDPDGSVVSEWLVHFRKGLLSWTERDHFDPADRSIRFAQLSGDFLLFDGTWRIDGLGDGSVVHFDARFDLGIPTLADLLDPVAESALRGNILRILGGLFGLAEPLSEEPERQPDLEGAEAA